MRTLDVKRCGAGGSQTGSLGSVRTRRQGDRQNFDPESQFAANGSSRAPPRLRRTRFLVSWGTGNVSSYGRFDRLGATMTIYPLSIRHGSRVLIAGAGGGFDVFCGLPIAFELEQKGCSTHFASFSFTDLRKVCDGRAHSTGLLEVTSRSTLSEGDYFPESYICRWYRAERNAIVSVWCLPQRGVVPTLASYDWLVEHLGIDVVICIDGGIDGIFRGDEHDLATPSMDSISVIATALCKAAQRIYACAAFGVEGAEGRVSHAQGLQRIAEYSRHGSFLGVGAIVNQSSAGAEFLRVLNDLVQRLSPLRQSVVLNSLRASLLGQFGHLTVHVKTSDRQPWISPLTQLIWYLDARAVAEGKLFFADARHSQTVSQVADSIDRHREASGVAPYQSIPI